MLYIIFAALIVAGDQLFKRWIVANVELFGQAKLLPGIVHLTHIRNTGAAFSIMADMRWILVAVSAIAAVVIIIYIFKSRIGVLGKLSAAAVLGGAVGNLIDRALLGYVVDMFEVEFMKYAVFNVADCFIVVGGIVFVICYIVSSAREEKRTKELGDKKLEPARMPELERLKNAGRAPVEPKITESREPEEAEGGKKPEDGDGGDNA